MCVVTSEILTVLISADAPKDKRSGIPLVSRYRYTPEVFSTDRAAATDQASGQS